MVLIPVVVVVVVVVEDIEQDRHQAFIAELLLLSNFSPNMYLPLLNIYCERVTRLFEGGTKIASSFLLL